jgi:hypothetical protein
MPADNLIDGRAIAEQIHAETAERIATLQARGVGLQGEDLAEARDQARSG